MIHKVNDIFTPSQVESLNEIVDRLVIPKVDNSPGSQYVSSINNNGTGVCEELGRLQVSDIWSSEELLKKINQIVRSLTDTPLSLKHSMYVEYSNKYGIPNLPPHFDKDDGDLIVNYQLKSNTSWGVGVGLDIYDLEDNSAVVFNGNTHIHWRPHKQFKDKDYIRMIFFRFHNRENPSDYSQLPENQADIAFSEAINLRERLILTESEVEK
jgi:hypothetical protein